jgi:glycosyltransferase involved in cell wall biosynthesis
MSSYRHPTTVLALTPFGINARAGGSNLAAELLSGWRPNHLGDVYIPARAAQLVDSNGKSMSIVSSPVFPRSSSAVASSTRAFLRGEALTADHLWTFRETKSLSDLMALLKPEMVYTHVGPPWMIKLALQLHHRYDVPVVTHIMDDYIPRWPATSDRKSHMPGARIANRRLQVLVQKLFDVASLRLTISDRMTDTYSRRYGHSFATVTHAIDAEACPFERPAIERGRELELFFGGFVSERVNRRALVELSRQAEAYTAASGRPIRILIATTIPSNRIAQMCEGSRVLEYLGTLPRDQYKEALQRADVLVLPFNSDEACRQYVRLSWPTKLAEYLASGTPVLYVGPRDTAVYDYIGDRELAFFLPPEADKTTRKHIFDDMHDVALRRTMGQRAKRAALNDFKRKTRDERFNDAVRIVKAGG